MVQETPGPDATTFGSLADWQTALKRFEREWPYIVQGLTPPATADDADACTLRIAVQSILGIEAEPDGSWRADGAELPRLLSLVQNV